MTFTASNYSGGGVYYTDLDGKNGVHVQRSGGSDFWGNKKRKHSTKFWE